MIGGPLISLLITLLVVGIVIALVYYVADAIPIPQPFNKILKIAAMVVGCIILILLLMQLAGGLKLASLATVLLA